MSTSSMKWLASLVMLIAGFGCTASNGRTYRSEEWKSGRSLGKVLVIVPSYRVGAGEDRLAKDQKIRDALRGALAQLPGTTVIDDQALGADAREAAAPISEASALAAGRKLDAQTVCLVTVGQFGGRYLLTLLPPGWDSRTTVQCAVRVIDVKSGDVLLNAVRERTAGGYLAVMTATYPSDLQADLARVLSTRE